MLLTSWANSGCITKHRSMPTTSCDAARRKPSLPSPVTAMRTVVRSASWATAAPRTMATSGNRPVRAKASRTTSTLASCWAVAARCCQSQPPQPSATCAHGGTTRCGDGATMPVARPRAKSRLTTISSTSTVSPGKAPSTNTTRPSASRAIASPPATRRSICS